MGSPGSRPRQHVPRPALRDGSDSPGTLKGQHRQVVDAYAPNDGFPLAFALTFLATNGPARAGGVPATAVVVLRHTAFPLALDHTMWQKYKIGQSLSILDPETGAAMKKPISAAEARTLTVDEMAIDRVLADGVVIGACNIALKVFSGKLAHNAGVSAGEKPLGVGCEHHSWDHSDPIRHVGPQPSPGARLHLLRRGLIRAAADLLTARSALGLSPISRRRRLSGVSSN